jgi:hypothetical protein
MEEATENVIADIGLDNSDEESEHRDSVTDTASEA